MIGWPDRPPDRTEADSTHSAVAFLSSWHSIPLLLAWLHNLGNERGRRRKPMGESYRGVIRPYLGVFIFAQRVRTTHVVIDSPTTSIYNRHALFTETAAKRKFGVICHFAPDRRKAPFSRSISNGRLSFFLSFLPTLRPRSLAFELCSLNPTASFFFAAPAIRYMEAGIAWPQTF